MNHKSLGNADSSLSQNFYLAIHLLIQIIIPKLSNYQLITFYTNINLSGTSFNANTINANVSKKWIWLIINLRELAKKTSIAAF